MDGLGRGREAELTGGSNLCEREDRSFYRNDINEEMKSRGCDFFIQCLPNPTLFPTDTQSPGNG